MGFLKNIPSAKTDEELVLLYQRTKDVREAAQLFQRYLDLIYGVCLKYLKVPEEAQDSAMMIYEELCTKLLKHEVNNFKSWLYTVTKNHCLMRLRQEKGKKWVDLDVSLVQSEENLHLNGVLEKEAQLAGMEQCLKQLLPAQKTAIELFYLQGKCYNEIAEQTGLQWKEVRSFIQNGRRNLKICMDKQKSKGAFSA